MHLGTLIYTWLNGVSVGTDEFGNRYYRARKDTLHGREKRWVVYKGPVEGSRVPAQWHSWLHHMSDQPLSEKAAESKTWQKSHQANPTGTGAAYLPQGHAYLGGRRAPATGDYEPWSPE
ncbi:MAG: NADH:ubiquinone oxidoreductase subunit NDUFA12 [Rhodospirillales bacterium]|nr:NADH:ubiquinone oxidoreductase subunit NDUFA12 [Alphaproteobacteria bacterium]MBL6948169.1 NADH:ubiquinone oxidoreductase subunit NDUFA12 [Rhodospirillales bacterium]